MFKLFQQTIETLKQQIQQSTNPWYLIFNVNVIWVDNWLWKCVYKWFRSLEIPLRHWLTTFILWVFYTESYSILLRRNIIFLEKNHNLQFSLTSIMITKLRYFRSKGAVLQLEKQRRNYKNLKIRKKEFENLNYYRKNYMIS